MKKDGFDDDESSNCVYPETIRWLGPKNSLPIWSRMLRRNSAGKHRNIPITKFKEYDIEINGSLWSLWGSLHPKASVFNSVSRGKQYLACNILACCAAAIYPLTVWNSQLLDSIVINGNNFFLKSLSNITKRDYQYSLENLDTECTLEHIKFYLHIEHVLYGKLYCQQKSSRMNLAKAFICFFKDNQYGILQSNRRSMAIGKTLHGSYFVYDCESTDNPLFPTGQGASYVLRTTKLQMLLYCIVVTLNIPYYNVEFSIHKVDVIPEGLAIRGGKKIEK